MNVEQKRAVVPVAIVLGVTFVAGMIMSLCVTNSQAVSPFVVGAIGPLMLIPDLLSAPSYVIAACLAVLFAWGCYAEVARGAGGGAALAASFLGMLWVLGVFWVSILTNLNQS